MALIVRIDVDRPYGKHPFYRHVLSRMASDLNFPRINAFSYLDELREMLLILNERNARAYVFFRRCTLPSPALLQLLDVGGHQIGLHLENSRSEANFLLEKENLEQHCGRKITAVSKHGSGGARYGYHHYAPYEPEKYVQWSRGSGMKLFLGNLEDPSTVPVYGSGGFVMFPSAFWLEPSWRDTKRFKLDWLFENSSKRDVVLLVHPENVLESPELTESFTQLVGRLETTLLP